MNTSSHATDTPAKVESLGMQHRSDEYAIAIDWTALRSWKVPVHRAVASEKSTTTLDVPLYRPKTRRKERVAH